MTIEKDLRKTLGAVQEFVSMFTEDFGRKEREKCCDQYITGLLLPGERKSIEPLSRRVAGSDVQSLQQFVNQSPWDYEAVLKKLALVVSQKFRLRSGIIVLDDTPLRKKGHHSVGVAPQYCGTVGAVANCQSVVTLHAIADKIHFPFACQLYLPKEWTDDRVRMKRAGVPDENQSFEEKWRIALQLLQKYTTPFKPECLLFDAGYGEIRPFLAELDRLNVPFVGQVPLSHSFWPVQSQLDKTTKATGRPRKFPAIANKKNKALTAEKWSQSLTDWKTIRLSSGQKISCACIRVFEATAGAYYRPGPERWLLIAKCSDGKTRYFVSNFPLTTSIKTLASYAFSRWKIEQGYQQLKEELGLDHFEGRSWNGLHHHLTVCFMTYAFLLCWRQSKKKSGSLFQLLAS